jgi:tRNA-dihydrouridine synthase
MGQAALQGKEVGAQIIDVNMGCPVKKVTRNGAGSALLCDPPRAAAIIRAIRDATGLPVTAKIRSGWDAQHRNYLRWPRPWRRRAAWGWRSIPAPGRRATPGRRTGRSSPICAGTCAR